MNERLKYRTPNYETTERHHRKNILRQTGQGLFEQDP
jgi:hypothetical protein